jgi:hypothetical protein
MPCVLWERLPSALERVMLATGLSKEDAQNAICRAITDRAVQIRGKLGKHSTRPMTGGDLLLEGKDFHIPAEIKPEELDWEQSRPLKPWPIRREIINLPGTWDVEWIELLRTDVTTALCVAGKPGEAGRPAATEKGASRTRPALERAQDAIQQLYPTGVPGQPAEPNARLCRRVGERLKQDGLPGVSDDTILRAAGRRK